MLGELDDDLVTIHGGPHDGRKFRQIELEVEFADEDLVDAILRRFSAAGARLDDGGPKLARALDVPSSGRAGIGGMPIEKPSTVGDVVQASIAKALNRILDHDYRLRIDSEGQPAHSIHQTRVASRRLRSDLKTFRDLLDPIWVRNVRGDLKWIGSVLGEVRDADVLSKRFAEYQADGSVDSEGILLLQNLLDKQRNVAAARLATALTSGRYLLLLDKLHAAAQVPPFVASGLSGPSGHRSQRRKPTKELPRLVRRPWKKLRRQVRQVGSDPTNEEFHQIRIRAKHLRYAAEAAQPVIGKPAGDTAKAAEQVQSLLGSHQDAVVAQRWLREHARTGPPAAAFVAGQLTSGHRRSADEVRRLWPGAWRELKSKKTRRWLL